MDNVVYSEMCDNFSRSTMYALLEALDNWDSSLYVRNKSVSHGVITYVTAGKFRRIGNSWLRA